MSHCEDCGTKMWGHKCPNCHEELCIIDQYIEQEMGLPNEDTEFMKRARKQEEEIAKNQSKEY